MKKYLLILGVILFFLIIFSPFFFFIKEAYEGEKKEQQNPVKITEIDGIIVWRTKDNFNHIYFTSTGDITK